MKTMYFRIKELNMRKRRNTSNVITLPLLVLGIFFLAMGIYRDEVSIVLQKAINICLECVGIG